MSSELDILLKAVSIGLQAGLKAFAEGMESVPEPVKEKPKRGRKPKKAAAAAAVAPETEKAVEEPVKKTRKKRGPKGVRPGRKKLAGRRRKGGVSDTDAVLKVIEAEENGIDQDELAEKSGFSKSKVHGIVYRLKKQEKIRSDRKGFYEKI